MCRACHVLCFTCRSEQWLEAYFSLMQSFTDECTVYDIPCFVSKTIPTDKQTMPTCQ